MTAAFVATSLAWASPASAAATDYYVSTLSGADTNDGLTVDTPLATIGAAIIAASAGDTIRVAAGTYAEAVVVTKSLTILGPNATVNPVDGGRSAEAVIDGTGNSATVGVDIKADNVTVKGFEVADWSGIGVRVLRGFGSGSDGTYWTYPTIQNNWIHDTTDHGVSITRTYGGVSIIDNLIEDVGTSGLGSGISYYYDSAAMAPNAIQGNLIQRTGYAGILTNGLTATISGNVIQNIPRYGLQINGNMNGTMTVSGNLIDSACEVIAECVDAGAIRIKNPIWQPGSSLVIRNNVLADSYNGVAVLDTATGLSNITFTLNYVIANGSASVLNMSAETFVADDIAWGGPPTTAVGDVTINRWLTAFTFDPAKSGQPGFWPIEISYGLPATGEPQDVAISDPAAGNPFLTLPPSSTPVEVTVAALDEPVVSVSGAPFALEGAKFLDIDVQGTFVPGAEFVICVDGSAPSRLWHYESDMWVDVTDESIIVEGKVCGVVTSFSPFVLAEAMQGSTLTLTTSDLDGSIDPADTVDLTATVEPVDVEETAVPSGTVDFGYCYSASAMPTTCTTPTAIDSEALNGSGVALVDDWAPGTSGYYLVVASYSGDEAFDVSSDDTTLTVRFVSTLTYTGSRYVTASGSVPLAVTLSGQCVSGQSVAFYIDTDGDGTYELIDHAGTDGSGVATMLQTLGTGVHELRVDFTGNADCMPTYVTAAVVVAGAGDSSSGGGHYTVSSLGKVNVGYTVQVKVNKRTQERVVSGQLVWNSKEFRVKGAVTGYTQVTCPADALLAGFTGKCASVTGFGNLFEWNAETEGWDLVASNVSFTLTVADGLTTVTTKKGGTKVNPDYLKMYVPTYAPSGSGSWELLRGGNLIVK